MIVILRFANHRKGMGAGPRQHREYVVAEPDSVLIISQVLSTQNVIEQVCRVYGYLPVSVEELTAAEAILIQRGQHPFALVVIDLRVLGDAEEETLQELPNLLEKWAKPPLHIPCLYLGSVAQKYRAFAARTAPVCFLTMPFSAFEFGEAMCHTVCRRGRMKKES